MYIIKYGNQVIHDPRSDSQVVSGRVVPKLNEVSSLTFEIPPTHPLCGNITKMDKSNEVTVIKDGTEIFRGRVTDVSTSIDGSESYTCEGQRAYLNDVLLPIYDTSDGTGGAPATVDGLFEWYIAQYNAKADIEHQFVVGVNQGASLDPNNYVLRNSSKRTAVWTEVRDKLLNKLGGYIHMRYIDGIRYIDYLSDVPSVSRQHISLQRNMLSFKRKSAGNEVYSSFVPVGKDEDGNDVGIESIADGWIDERYYKRGESVVDARLEESMGIVECLYKCDAATPSGVYTSCVHAIMKQDYVDSITVGAYDLSNLGIESDALEEGTYIRVTNSAANTDEYMICTARSLNICKPEQDTYTVGITANSYSIMANESDFRIRSSEDDSQEAKSIADSKKRVFTSEPTPPYSVGDLWVRTLEDGSIVVMVCTTAKGRNTPFDLNDWLLASTDDTTATKAQIAASVAQSTADAAQSTANTAKKNAATAQSTANTAKKNAATAQSTADSAITDALNAQSTADEAITNAATAQETADTAQSTADTARTEAADAAKTATNYLSYDETDGLVVGNQTGGTLEGNVQICTVNNEPTINLRNGSTVLAKFDTDEIELGANSAEAVIKLLKNSLKIGAYLQTSSSGFSYMAVYRGLTICPVEPGTAGWAAHPHIQINSSGVFVGSTATSAATYDLIRKQKTITRNSGACTANYLQAYTMGGMCFVSGQVTPTSAGTDKMLMYIAGVEPMYQTFFPITAYGHGGSEGYVKNVNSGQSHIYFNIPETADWKFNFAFAIA